MMFIDTRLPFGRSDSARVFQQIAKALVEGLRLRYPKEFTIPLTSVSRIKGFIRLQPRIEDTFCIVNYLDDNLLAQFCDFQKDNQLKALKCFFDGAGVAVKWVEKEGPIGPRTRKVALGFKHDTILQASTWKDDHIKRVLDVLVPIATGCCSFIP